MTATIFLHIGTNKTGTTAVQHFFAQQRDALKEHGVLYPATACNGVAHYALGTALGFSHGKKSNIDTLETELLSLKDAFRNEIEQSAAQTVLISAENFFGAQNSIQPVQSFFADYDTRIIIYLRRHDSWWESAYNQAVKMTKKPLWNHGIKSYIRYMKRKNPNYGSYRTLVDQWADAFGKENIIVRPYEQQQNQPDIISDFLHTIGLPSLTQQLTALPERKNESLPFFALNLIDIYKRADVDPEIRSSLIKQAMTISENNKCSSISSPVLRRQLVDENMQDYEYIAKEYLGREDGRLFYDSLPDPEEAWSKPRYPTLIDIVESTVQAMQQIDTKPRPL